MAAAEPADPNRAVRVAAAQDQARAVLRHAIDLSIARSLATRLAVRDLSAGQWVVHLDGRTERVLECGAGTDRHFHPIPPPPEEDPCNSTPS